MLPLQELPSLDLLQSFEAVARHLSFTNAARELHITQSAVSHQIRALESYLGVSLFLRQNRRVLLSPEGQVLFPAVISAFQGLGEALEQVQESPEEQALTMAVGPQFGANWMAHRIGSFQRQHPEVTLHLHISHLEPNFTQDRGDLGVYWGRGLWQNLHQERLMPLEYTPVCSLGLLDPDHPIRTPEDLQHYPLLHGYDYKDWRRWLEQSGYPHLKYRRGSVINDFNVLLHSAIDGYGVALCGLEMIQDHLDAGRLTRLFDYTFTSDGAYYLVCPTDALERPLVRLFRDWLIAEVASTETFSSTPPNQETP